MKIFVANFPYYIEESDIRKLFELFGPVDSIKMIIERGTGKSKGYGFLEMYDEQQANKAITGLNSVTIGDRELIVKQAEVQPSPQEQPSHHGNGKRPRIKFV